MDSCGSKGEPPVGADKQVVVFLHSVAPQPESEPLLKAIEAVTAYVKRLVDDLFFSASDKADFLKNGAISLSLNDETNFFPDESVVDRVAISASIGKLVSSSSKEIRTEMKRQTARINKEDAFLYGLRKLIRVLLKNIKIPANEWTSLCVGIENPFFSTEKTTSLSSILAKKKQSERKSKK